MKLSATLLLCTLLSLSISACSSSSSQSNQPIVVGSEGPGGGIVFAFLDDENTTGLEVNPVDIGQAAWGCAGVNIDEGVDGRASNGIGAPPGAESSEILRSVNSSGICFAEAAELTFQFNRNGFNDWYLPSTDELIAIRELGLLPGVSGDAYWSATEDSPQNAFIVLIRVDNNPLDTGEPSTTDKTNTALVIPIRTF